jgi:hypothetical protein
MGKSEFEIFFFNGEQKQKGQFVGVVEVDGKILLSRDKRQKV